MGDRARALAERFEQANRELIAAIEECSEARWRTRCLAEDWSVGVTAHHVAEHYPLIVFCVRALAGGQPLPALSRAKIDQLNAHHARLQADCGREETAALLRRNGAAAASLTRGLADEQLDRSAAVPFLGGAVLTAEQVIEQVLIGHIHNHLRSIRAAEHPRRPLSA